MSTQATHPRTARSLRFPLAAASALLLALSACSGDVASPAAVQPLDANAAAAGPSFHRSGSGRNAPRLYRNRDRYRERGHRYGEGHVGDVSVQGTALLGANRVTSLILSTGTLDPLVAGNGSITQVKVKAYDPRGNKLYVSNFNHLTPAGIQTLPLNGLTVGSILYIRAHVRGARAHNTNCGCHGRDRDRDYDRDHGRDNDRDGRGHDDDDDHDRGHGSSRGNDRDRHDDSRWEHRGDDDDDDCDDDPRTDVVTLVDTVKAAAALHVDLNVPPKVIIGAPTVISATVSEINGDVGTRADCVLYVNGQQVDSALGIWVDAGDAVTCAFTYRFLTPGTKTVEVKVNGVGGPSTVAVDTDTATFDVVNPVETTFTASVEDKSVANTTILDYTWVRLDGGHKEYSNTEVTTTRTQAVSLQGTLTRSASFPLTSVDLVLESSSIQWEVEHWSSLPSTPDASGQACTNQQMPEEGAMFYLCNNLLGAGATFGYSRFAGSVTYHSHGFSNTFDGPAATADNYTWNDTYPLSVSGGQIRPFGTQVKLTLSVRDAVGSWNVAPVVNLTPYTTPVTITLPRTCAVSSPYWLDGGSLNECNTHSTQEFGSRGTTTG